MTRCSPEAGIWQGTGNTAGQGLNTWWDSQGNHCGRNIQANSESDACNTFPKTWDRGVFTSLFVCLFFNKTESIWKLRTVIVDVLKVEFFPSLAWYMNSVSQQGVSLFCILCFILCHTLSMEDRSGLQAGTAPALLYYQVTLMSLHYYTWSYSYCPTHNHPEVGNVWVWQ